MSNLKGETFRPVLNQKTTKIAQTLRKNQSLSTWENLYNLDKIKKEEIEKKRLEILQKKEQDEMSNCTFEPKIS